MSKENLCNKIKSKEGIFTLILNQIFHSKPKNRDELVKCIRNSKKNKFIDEYTRKMLEGVMKISLKRVRDIMTPRSQMITLRRNQILDECLDIIKEHSHSSFPVISEDKDHIEGILMTQDLLKFIRHNTDSFNIEKILRRVIIVPESKRVDRMLREFRSQHNHMAIVIDEFGSISGLITIEDIIDLIVGDIEDEYSGEDNINCRQMSRHIWTISALMSIKDFNNTFGTHFSYRVVDTIGGLMMQALGHLPVRGESVDIDGYQFKVAMANSRRIIQVHVRLPSNPTLSKLQN